MVAINFISCYKERDGYHKEEPLMACDTIYISGAIPLAFFRMMREERRRRALAAAPATTCPPAPARCATEPRPGLAPRLPKVISFPAGRKCL